MTSYTAEPRLPFPDPTDRPCDLAAVFAEAVPLIEAELLDLQTIRDRVLPAVPVVVIQMAAGVATVGQQVGLEFDAVMVDTPGAVDLAVNRFRVTLPIDGVWLVVGSFTVATAETSGGATTTYDTVLSDTVFGPGTAELGVQSGGTMWATEDRLLINNGPATRESATCVAEVVAATGKIVGLDESMLFTADVAAAITDGVLAMCWMRDLG